jgi:hypothetical protein
VAVLDTGADVDFGLGGGSPDFIRRMYIWGRCDASLKLGIDRGLNLNDFRAIGTHNSHFRGGDDSRMLRDTRA